jgi:superfamily II DNA or RNA helicase
MVPKSKGLVIVPRVQLAQQLYSDWCQYSRLNGFDVEQKVSVIYAGKDKSATGRVTISTWRSLFELPPEYFEQFTYVIGDEAHEFKAKSLTYIMNSCVNAWDRTGLTGTLDGTVTNKMVLEGLFGPAQKIISSKELMNQGAIAKLNPIKVLLLKHSKEKCKIPKVTESDYENEIQYLIGSEERNNFITNLALSLKGNTLLLYQRVANHGVVLHDLLKAKKKNVYLIHGGIEMDEREEIRRIVESETDAIIVASYGTFSTGINIRNLHNVIFASPSKSRIRNLQSIGRGLRIGDSKDSATLFDIADDLRANPNGPANFTYNHMEERLKIYISEKFPYKMYNIQLGTINDKESISKKEDVAHADTKKEGQNAKFGLLKY